MKDYYKILEISNTASPDEIKKSYRSLAMKHHPDRGGDEARFKEIEEAYRILSDSEKRNLVDSGVDPNNPQQNFNRNPFDFHFDSNNINDFFGTFGFGQHRQQKNKTLNIKVAISLLDVLTGKDVSAEVSSPQGRNKIININIPPGIESGQQIRYEGMGDTSNTNLPPGDLIVNVIVSPNLSFRRSGTILIIEKDISVWDAILGTSINIITLDNKTLNINIPAGTQPDTVFSCKGEGLPDMRTRQRGNLMLKLKVKVPTTILPEHAELIKHIKNEL